MMESMGKSDPKPSIQASSGITGTYIAYDRAGNEMWRGENFTIGVDKAPGGLSIGMGAMRVVDPKTGETLKQWNPWGVLDR